MTPRIPCTRRTLRTLRTARAVLSATVAVVAVGAAGAVGTAAADTTGDIPGLPDLRGVDGVTGSILNRHLGTGDQPFCSDFGRQLDQLSHDWDEARRAAAQAHRDGDAAAEASARATANTLRITFTNVNAANLQCLTAADAALTSSPQGSVTGSLPV